MATNYASDDAPMTLARRDELQQHQIAFSVPPHEVVINSNAGDLMTEQELRNFVDGILSKLVREFPSIKSPKPGAWKLSTKDIDEDLREWNPHKLASGALVVIKSNLENHRPVITGTVATRERSWGWARTTRTLELPCQDVFVLDLDSHVLLILRCQTKVKVFGKPKKVTETTHGILVPNGHTVSDVVETIRANHVNGVYQDHYEDNLRHDQRSATELGWTNGTTLRLELW